MSKTRQLADLEDQFTHLANSEGMDLRDTFVYYDGNPDAAIVIVGEAPGEEEESAGLPFVGAAGRLLKDALIECGYRKRMVYITNILKFRPATKKGVGNRPPKWREIRPFRKMLLKELGIVAPRVVICLGGSALRGVLGMEDLKIGQEISNVYDMRGMLVAGTYHPSYAMRTGGRDSFAYRTMKETLAWAAKEARKEKG